MTLTTVLALSPHESSMQKQADFFLFLSTPTLVGQSLMHGYEKYGSHFREVKLMAGLVPRTEPI